MKFRTPELFLGVLLTVAIFAMGMLFASSPSVQPQNRNDTASAQQNSESKKPESHESAQSLWIPTDSVGLYTLVLAVFTGFLVVVSSGQGYFLLRADKTARIAANAADLSARAAIGLQLPIIRIEIPEFVGSSNTHGIGGIISKDPTIYLFTRITRLNIRNQGNSAAYPKEVGMCWLLTERTPLGADNIGPEPNYDWLMPIDSEAIISVDYRMNCGPTFALSLNDQQRIAIREDRLILRVCASIKYSDFLDQAHEARFCWRYFPTGRRGLGASLEVDESAPDSYRRKA